MSNVYQAALLAHAKRPHGAGSVPRGTEDGAATNTACGDEIRVALAWTPEHTVAELVHQVHGCAVCTASASMASQRLVGRTRAEIAAMATAFAARLGKTGFEDAWGDFQAFNGIERFPARIRCATLVWEAIERALEKAPGAQE